MSIDKPESLELKQMQPGDGFSYAIDDVVLDFIIEGTDPEFGLPVARVELTAGEEHREGVASRAAAEEFLMILLGTMDLSSGEIVPKGSGVLRFSDDTQALKTMMVDEHHMARISEDGERIHGMFPLPVERPQLIFG